MSMPPEFYARCGPNPALRAFARKHARSHPYDEAEDSYEPGPFTETIETTKQSPIYSLHAYHLGKKPHDAIRSYVRHFTRAGDLVLDPFCGSGSTALAASLEHRKAIAIDASPAATFIARYYLAQIDPTDFARRFEVMAERVREELAGLYATTCHRCGGPGTIHYVIYSNTYACPACGEVISLFEATHQGRSAKCPRCRAATIGPKLGAVGSIPVAVNFSCMRSCKPKRTLRSICGTTEERRAFDDIDRRAIEALERKPIPHWVPNARMMNVQSDDIPWGDEWRPSRDFRTVRALFTHRNLWAVSALMEAAGDDPDLQALITSGMLAVSRKAQHLDAGGGYIPGNWALPPMTKQRNVLESLTKVFRRALRAREQLAREGMGREVCISNQSSAEMRAIPDDSVDYIFTDPPYGGAVQYAELNFVWEAWLRFDSRWHEDEIVVNRTRGLSADAWAERLSRVLSECRRVLKPGRWISVCYHDVSSGTWSGLQDAIAEAGLINASADRAVAIDTGGRTYNQYTVDKVTKRDLVLNLRKPRRGEWVQTRLPLIDFEAQARATIESFLRQNPGASKDRVYDDLVAKLVRSSTLRPHDFERILREVAREGSPQGRVVDSGARKGATTAKWFLR